MDLYTAKRTKGEFGVGALAEHTVPFTCQPPFNTVAALWAYKAGPEVAGNMSFTLWPDVQAHLGANLFLAFVAWGHLNVWQLQVEITHCRLV